MVRAANGTQFQLPHDEDSTKDLEAIEVIEGYEYVKPSLCSKLFCCFQFSNYESKLELMTMVNSASKHSLLPDQKDGQDKICLILDLDETLIHSSFKEIDNPDFVVNVPVGNDDATQPIYVSKRPGVDEFLQEIGEHFEIVIFTASVPAYANPVIDLLDVNKVVKWRLFRDSCTLYKGSFVKDLSKIGRSLSQTIIIDNSPISYLFHSDIAIAISTWTSNPSDNELTALAPFLLSLTHSDDVKPQLKKWNSGHRNIAEIGMDSNDD